MFASCPHCGGVISDSIFVNGGDGDENEDLTIGQKIDRIVKALFFMGIGLFLIWILLSKLSSHGFKFDLIKLETPVVSIDQEETYPIQNTQNNKNTSLKVISPSLKKPITKKEIIYKIAKEEEITYDEQVTYQYQIWSSETDKVALAENIKKIFKEKIKPKNEFIYIVDFFNQNPSNFLEAYPISEWEAFTGRFLYLNKVVLENEIIPDDYNEIGSNLYVKWENKQ